jgi:hypothetical protein
MRAVFSGRKEVVHILLSKGAIVNHTSRRSGLNACLIARKNHEPNLLRLLEEAQMRQSHSWWFQFTRQHKRASTMLLYAICLFVFLLSARVYIIREQRQSERY